LIPIRLTLTNFLSYHQLTEVDFTPIHLACISGNNGAGKSSLVDAITWALFGKARRNDDALIFGEEDHCEVTFEFEYSGNTYRINRTRSRNKTGTLNLFIRHPNTQDWLALSENSIRDTDAYIQKVLRMDYETFINASFFLQGKADQFSQQKPGDRKRILGSILGLDVWETYREKAAEKRHAVDGEIINIDGRMSEIHQELAEEEQRKKTLAGLETALKDIAHQRKQQETQLERFRQMENTLKEQKKLLETLKAQFASLESTKKDIETRFRMRRNEIKGFQELLEQADQIDVSYKEYQKARLELEKWNTMANRMHEIERQMVEPRLAIEKKQATLQQELRQLQQKQQQVESVITQLTCKQQELAQYKTKLDLLRKITDQKPDIESERNRLHQKIADLRSENARLKGEMNDLEERRKQLEEIQTGSCPVCGQDLNPEHRAQVIADINTQGKQKGDQFRANQADLSESEKELKNVDDRLAEVNKSEAESTRLQRQADQLQIWLGQNLAVVEDWKKVGEVRLQEVTVDLDQETFDRDQRSILVESQLQIRLLGYDAVLHGQVKEKEAALRHSEEEYRQVGEARATLAPLQRELVDLEKQVTLQGTEAAHQQENIQQATASYNSLAVQVPDLASAEKELQEYIEKDNSIRQQVGAARQKVEVLDSLRIKLNVLTHDREELAIRSGRYKTLEKAFSKDGVPALLIEQALPEIEAEANEILDRLSGGAMNIRFLTQRDYKDKTREDKKETLDIRISDPSGIRDYELFSGGEAFRVNFAIRLALSRVLAQRADTRLQTLVIDEGFGSQDSAGRQRLIEAINMVQDDFAKVLVITHLEELKDSFPSRIEVEKTPNGSVVQVIA
jgi:DNA repair protein SbcC/Rad50